jgi:bifunctional non-homologous end joining protein LigD
LNIDKLPGAVKINKIIHIRPMLATLIERPFNDRNWIFEIKWDGYRAIAEIMDRDVSLYSRNGKSFNELFSPLAESLGNIKYNLIADGEIVIVDKNGKSDFGLLQRYLKDKSGTLLYYVFDLLYINGYSLLKVPLLQRKEILLKVLSPQKDFPNIIANGHIETTGIDFFKVAAENGLEGIIAKNKNSYYEPGIRSKNWLKIKAKQSQEVVIGGFTAPRGHRGKIGSLVTGVYKGKNLIFTGQVGGGMDEKEIDDLRSRLDKLLIDKSPFEIEPKTNTHAQWVKPILVAEVKFSEWTKDNLMRQPVFLGLRIDKTATNIHFEKPREFAQTKK